MVIETKRLILREYTKGDFADLKDIICDAETMKYYVRPYDENGVQRWLDWCIKSYAENGFGLWAIELKESGEFIGDCGISLQKIDGEILPEIGYHINKKHWRRGYAKEAATAVRDWLFESTDFERAYSYMNRENAASYSTAASVGMKKIKEYNDGEEDLAVYSISRDEWRKIRLKERAMIASITISREEVIGYDWIDYTSMHIKLTKNEYTENFLYIKTVGLLIKSALKKTQSITPRIIYDNGSFNVQFNKKLDEYKSIIIGACDWITSQELSYPDKIADLGEYYTQNRTEINAFFEKMKKILTEEEYKYYFQRVDGRD